MQHEQFEKVRDELLADKKKFDAESMSRLNYKDIIRCGISDALEARANLHAVKQAVVKRLLPYLSMNNQELEAEKSALEEQGMLEDVLTYRGSYQSAPLWADLSDVVKLYFRIKCLRAHWDNPVPRMQAITELCRSLSEQYPDNLLYSSLLTRSMSGMVPEAGKSMRILFSDVEALLDHMSQEEKNVCANGIVKHYACSGGCFKPCGL